MEGKMKLRKNPEWDEIEKVRLECESFFGAHQLSGNVSHSLVMIISELMENGIKYGDFSNQDSQIEISVDIHGSNVVIELTNPVSGSNETDLKKLDRTIQWIRGYQDPFEAFIERLRKVSKKDLYDTESGLGLVRVAYEGKAVVDFFVDEHNILNVSAMVGIENN